eukprot:365604-Chlamydomonas_euryale.AAC.7
MDFVSAPKSGTAFQGEQMILIGFKTYQYQQAVPAPPASKLLEAGGAGAACFHAQTMLMQTINISIYIVMVTMDIVWLKTSFNSRHITDRKFKLWITATCADTLRDKDTATGHEGTQPLSAIVVSLLCVASVVAYTCHDDIKTMC